MQYYKGGSFQKEEKTIALKSRKPAIFRTILFPFVLFYWIAHYLIYKSLESDE